MRPIHSIIEFKQIIGRGTRLYDGKDFFTIYDFVKAHQHFSDPEWDGEPEEAEACKKCGQHPCVCEKPPSQPCPACGQLRASVLARNAAGGPANAGRRPKVKLAMAKSVRFST